MSYLIKASVLILIFYVLYKLFLQKDTFFQSNRWFLLVGLLTSLVAPLVIIPVYVEIAPTLAPDINYEIIPENTSQQNHGLLDFLPYIYSLGVILFSVRLFIQLVSLGKLIFKNKRISKNRFSCIETNQDIPPFSFFKWIVYNPSQFNKTELDQIITHEKVHVAQLHSVDVLFSQIVCVLLWFNPFIWLYSKTLRQNLEFLADSSATNNVLCKKAYQYTLLKTSMPTHQLALSNPFYNSLIKKRIVMLQKSKSKKINQLKYVLVIPILAIFLMSFNTETIYIEKDPTEILPEPSIVEPVQEPLNSPIIIEQIKDDFRKESKPPKHIDPNIASAASTRVARTSPIDEKVEFIISKTSSDSDLDKVVEKGKKYGLNISFKNVKRNNDGEITGIKITAKSKSSNSNFNLDSDDSISPIIISFNKTTNSLSIGNANVIEKKGNSFVYKTKKGNHAISKSGKGNSVVVITEEDDNYKFKSATSSGNVKVISADADENVEIIVESDAYHEDHNSEEDDVIIISEDISKSDAARVKVLSKTSRDGNIIISAKDDKTPLFVIDGEQVDKGITDDLKPENIKSINVLKGASAKEKYGNKGENGVIEITTKK